MKDLNSIITEYSNIEDKIPEHFISLKFAATKLAQDLIDHWDIENPELIRVIALLETQNTNVKISQHIKKGCEVAGLYPHIINKHNIYPDTSEKYEYLAISTYYGDKTTERSKVKLINHIDEGLIILKQIGASTVAKRAYCLHPLVQSDEALLEFVVSGKRYLTGPTEMIAVMEYRSVANEYLSKRKINSIDEIRLSPLKDVNDMLIADKVQNYKDFELYHKGTHERSDELVEYFENWLKRLNVNYQELKKLIS